MKVFIDEVEREIKEVPRYKISGVLKKILLAEGIDYFFARIVIPDRPMMGYRLVKASYGDFLIAIKQNNDGELKS